MRLFTRALAASLFVLSLILSSTVPYVSAASISSIDTAQGGQATSANYIYKVAPGENMTFLVRKSVILYEQSNDPTHTISHAQIVYIETNVVRLLGSPQIYPGQQVKVPEHDISIFSAKSKDLTPSQIKAWQVYANDADFNLSWIDPIATPSSASDSTTSSGSSQKKASNQKTVSQKGTPTSQNRASSKITNVNQYTLITAICLAIVVVYVVSENKKK